MKQSNFIAGIIASVVIFLAFCKGPETNGPEKIVETETVDSMPKVSSLNYLYFERKKLKGTTSPLNKGRIFFSLQLNQGGKLGAAGWRKEGRPRNFTTDPQIVCTPGRDTLLFPKNLYVSGFVLLHDNIKKIMGQEYDEYTYVVLAPDLGLFQNFLTWKIGLSKDPPDKVVNEKSLIIFPNDLDANPIPPGNMDN